MEEKNSTTLPEAQQMVDHWIKTIGVRYFSELTNLAMLTEEVGELARIISRKTVELMTSNQIGNLNEDDSKFGLGFEISTEASQAKLGVTSGSFAWGGIYGTTYWADPKEKLVCLLFCQQWPLSHSEIGDKFRVLVYSALE